MRMNSEVELFEVQISSLTLSVFVLKSSSAT